ncbi:hypothetical protein JCM18882A_16020 [Brevibacterium metallidurans]|uniref:Uncharacterized protein n=1 Tax=Brevibacterium metallidurans TaxID=1482676 RepID=A0ABP3C829_9MICO
MFLPLDTALRFYTLCPAHPASAPNRGTRNDSDPAEAAVGRPCIRGSGSRSAPRRGGRRSPVHPRFRVREFPAEAAVLHRAAAGRFPPPAAPRASAVRVQSVELLSR